MALPGGSIPRPSFNDRGGRKVGNSLLEMSYHGT